MTETIYLNRDNKFDLQLKQDGSAVDLSTCTKIGLLFAGNYYHSDNWPSAIDYTTQATSGIITFDMAAITGIEAGRDRNTELIYYDATNPEGIVWGTFDLRILELEGTEVTP